MTRLPFWRRRAPKTSEQLHPDQDRIAVLEHELLGLEPQPGTPAARAVALAKPVDQNTCPHDDVIDITEMGQPRPTGMCQRCGADMVADDNGDWKRP